MAEAATMTPSSIPIPRMIGMVMSVAISAVIGYALWMWAVSPNYTSLYTGLEARDASEVVAALQSAGIPYELDGAAGVVMVESGRVHEARLKLAAQGLPKGTGIGIEILQEEQSFGTSQFVESARYHHAMETELARTISTMRNVKSARVHLAIPKRSVFVRNREDPSASVALSLYGGRNIEQGQVNSIVHLVASSISHMSAENVTVVDQNGRLLSSGGIDSNVAMTAKQYEYTRKVEEDYARRIEHLLEPIIGFGKVRATVNAEIDFTQEESTEEIYNPERQVVRSEQSSEVATFNANQAAGIPGALSNQPPEQAQLVEGAGNVGGVAVDGSRPLNSTKNSVRNYELDRTIRHKRQGTGEITRLTVAVLLDDRVVVEDGEEERTPLTDAEIARITTLVQQTIGYDQPRGDLVNVINASFTPQEEVADLPEPSIMDDPLVKNSIKYLAILVIGLVVIFVLLKPSIKSLTDYTPPQPILPAPAQGTAAEAEAQAQLEHQQSPIPLPTDHDQKVDFAKAMVDQDARRVANVVKDWIGNEA